MRPALFSTFVLTFLALAAACTSGGGPSPDVQDQAPPPDTAPVATIASSTLAGGTPPPTVSLTPRPNTPAADPATARRLESEGEYAAAIDAYLSFAGAAAPNRTEGLTGAARLLLETGRPAEARTLLEPAVDTLPPREGAPARYLLARSYAALKLTDDALKQYDLYIQSGRPAAAYAYLDRARLLLDAGQPDVAANEAQLGLNASIPSAARRTYQLFIAQAYERAGLPDEARRWYQTLFDSSPVMNDQALALSRIAAIKQAQGDPTSAADYQRLLAQFPTTPQALSALTDLLAKGEAIDAYVRGLVYYRQNDYTKAAAAFADKVTAVPEAAASAESYYYLAAIYESRGQGADAQDGYAHAFRLNPQSFIADDALWWRARLLEDDGRLTDAAALYAQLIAGYPSSPFVADAAFRRGLLPYRAGRYRDAAAAWAEGLASVTDPDDRARLSLWQGKALLKAGDKDAAKPVLDKLASENDDDYFGIRAAAVARGQNAQPKATREANVDLAPSFDWAAAEAWLTQRTGRAISDVSVQAWSSDNRWLRAQELWLVGRTAQGDAEAVDLIDAYARDPIAMYSLARLLQSQGHIGLSGRAGQRLLRVLASSPAAGLPKALLSLSYPPAFAAGVQKYAQAEKVSPLLLLAFIRQESFFDPRAESPVGAVGLTQVLPVTAQAVAKRLGLGSVDTEALAGADLNLRLGAHYMADQLKSFDSAIFVAFAAYNAGPDPARRWLKSAGDDADLYLETVEFHETRLYIQFVAENYAIYRYLYGGEATPTLPGE